ncbi:MAG: nickel pincer cofactor biosynthesis protein LarB [Candidatus Tectomicrobia bacterium]|uniref:Nickel pincer cofactor biosynthesis protein LarB n=1 Tax=Tectimicrobiota bacterium TaxID=2528274 RepID=A0A933LQB9_UNCTE|nr:nickel pincer cofactor biosynthesis protein LarB [Candidatus Tectomicrobia bacterium]
MTKIRQLLEALQQGDLSIDELERILKGSEKLLLENAHDPGDLEGFARIDPHREKRTGIPEAIFAENKDLQTVPLLLKALAEQKGRAMATRVPRDWMENIRNNVNGSYETRVFERAGIIVVNRKDSPPPDTGGKVGVIAAGTSDVPVAEEAKITAEEMGCKVFFAYDVGIAGIHRLLPPLEEMSRSGVEAFVVVAGMEGALPAVVKGLVDVPVIGVPTSVGYGLGGKGVAALMSMLQSCSPGLVVVNIDNGFGAGATAALIANRIAINLKRNK